MKRGDVVMVDLQFTDVRQSKVRPGVVVLNDRDNQKIRKTIVAMVTGNLRRRGDRSHLFVDPGHPDGASSGLSYPCLVSCNNLYTVEQAHLQHIGHLSGVLMQQLNDSLKAALELP